MRETQRADFAAGAVIFVAELLGYPQAGVTVLLQEAKEILTFDEVYLARIDRLGSQLVRLAANCRAESQHLSRFGDFKDQCFAIGGADGELHTAFAQHKDPAWRLPFDKQDRAFRIGSGVFDGLERLQCGGWKIAKNMFCPHLASQAAFYDVQTIRCKHDGPPVLYIVSRFLRPECVCNAPRGPKPVKPPRLVLRVLRYVLAVTSRS